MAYENSPYKTPEEMAAATGLTLKEAASILTSWGYKQPEDPEVRLRYAQEGSRYEHAMRGLNADKSMGRISQEKYDAEAEKLTQEHQEKIQAILQK